MRKYKRKTEQKLVFTDEKMQETKRRVVSDESWQHAKSLGTDKCTLRKQLKAVSTCKNPGLFVRFGGHMKRESEHDICINIP